MNAAGIQALGGRVEPKVPRAGFVLVQPGTAEEERLRLCWSTPERPERYFVPYSYVEACKINGMLLKQIFIHEGQPIRMHIDSSIANVNVRATLATRIMVSPRIFLHLYRWANEVDRGWPRGAQEGQDGLVGVHGCSGLNVCMAAFWRRSHGERSIRARHPRGSEHGDLPASRQDIPGRTRQIRRVLPVGEEMY